jgi:hypothetical protein
MEACYSQHISEQGFAKWKVYCLVAFEWMYSADCD